MGHRCAKIHRARRSTLADESHDDVTAIDVALRFQVLMAVIFTHRFDYKRMTPPTEFHLINPFHESPPNHDVRKEADIAKLHAVRMSVRSASPTLSDIRQDAHATCNCCKVSMELSKLPPNDIESSDRFVYRAMLNNSPAIPFRPMVLADCCSLYGSIIRLQPKTAERCTRITIAFLRGSLQIAAFSYIDATVNLGVIGAKHVGIIGTPDRFL